MAPAEDSSIERWLRATGPLTILRPAPGMWLAHDHEADSAAGDVTVVAEPGGRAAEVARIYNHRLDRLEALPSPCTFVLYDARANRLVASADVVSQLPLAYWTSLRLTLIGSRLFSLLRHPDAPRRLDSLYLAHVITGFDSAPAGVTPIAGIRRLAAGETLILGGKGARIARTHRLRPARTGGSRADATAGFWEALDAAIGSPRTGNFCLSLSGGLDSAIVGAALYRRAPELPAFSLLAPNDEDRHEAEGVARFARAFPNTKIVRIDGAAGGGLPDLESYPLCDDPTLNPLGLLAGRLRLWETAREAGIGHVFDGEGGDEIFGSFISPLQAVLRGDVAAAAACFRAARRPRWPLVRRSLLLPMLPSPLRHRWLLRWGRDGTQFPSYVRRDARSQPAFVRANEEFLARFCDTKLSGAIHRWLSAPEVIGATLAQRTLAAACGVRQRSPLISREVIACALGLKPRWLLAGTAPKSFLREAARGRIPESLREKDAAMARALARRAVTSERARSALRQKCVRERLGEWLDLDRVDDILNALAAGDAIPFTLVLRMESLVTFADWYARARRDYGVD